MVERGQQVFEVRVRLRVLKVTLTQRAVLEGYDGVLASTKVVR